MAAGVGTLAVTGTASGKKVEIVTKRQAGEPYQTRRVPQDWWTYENQVRSVHQRLQKELDDNPAVSSVGIQSQESNKIEGVTVGQPVVRVTRGSSGGRPPGVPSETEGIPVAIEESVDLVPADHGDCGGFGSGKSVVEGGLRVYDEDGESFGTSGFLVYEGGEPYVLTANHVIYNGGCEDPMSLLYFEKGNSQIGPIYDYDVADDWALFSINDTDVTDSEDVINSSEDYNERSVNAYYTADGIDYLMNHDVTVHKEGTTTGESSGTIVTYGQSHSSDYEDCINISDGVEVGIHVDQGDSGGPIYHKDSDSQASIISNVSLIGLDDFANGSCDEFDDNWYIKKRAVGPPAWKLQENLGYDIGSPKDSL